MRQLREKNSKNTIKNELKKYSEVLEALDADCVKMKMSSNVKEKQEVRKLFFFDFSFGHIFGFPFEQKYKPKQRLSTVPVLDT